MIPTLEALAFMQNGMTNSSLPLTYSNTPFVSAYCDPLACFSVQTNDFHLDLSPFNLNHSNIHPYGIGFHLNFNDLTIVLMGDANLNPPFDIDVTNMDIYFPSYQQSPNFDQVYEFLTMDPSIISHQSTLKSYYIMGKVFYLQQRADSLKIVYRSDDKTDMLTPEMRVSVYGEGEDL